MTEVLQLVLIAAMFASLVAIPLVPYWLYLRHEDKKHVKKIADIMQDEHRMKTERWTVKVQRDLDEYFGRTG